MIYKVKDNNGINYEIKDIKNFAKHIFKFHGNGISLHQEHGHNFTVNDAFRVKILKFIDIEKKKKL